MGLKCTENVLLTIVILAIGSAFDSWLRSKIGIGPLVGGSASKFTAVFTWAAEPTALYPQQYALGPVAFPETTTDPLETVSDPLQTSAG